MNKILKEIDPILITAILALLIIALLSLYSASHKPDGTIPRNYCLQQVIWIALALLISGCFLWLGYERFIDYSYWLLAINIILLALVLAVGDARLGAKRWLSLGLFNLQPSELCKVSFILVLVRYISTNQHRIGDIRIVATSLLICLIPMLLIIKQPDLGTAIVFLPIFFVILFTAGAKIWHIICIFSVGLATCPLLWFILKAYQKKRLLVFLNPNMDPLGAGYTVIQSKIAIGSGGFFGKGWLSGTQNQLNFLPERHTDFIFSVIGEEWGLAGAFLVLMLFIILINRLLRIADTTNDEKGKLLVTGIVTLLWFQVIVNIAMTLGLMPVVGLPLPLISYGGSSLATTMVLIALALSVKMRRKIF
ncbi:MAG: rod shape-determining protein RodA [Candidatus Omnitrophica bacterium]|nr:rod shape-determining protein RodA [Candidatus Omnitrophota bacterium]